MEFIPRSTTFTSANPAVSDELAEAICRTRLLLMGVEHAAGACVETAHLLAVALPTADDLPETPLFWSTVRLWRN